MRIEQFKKRRGGRSVDLINPEKERTLGIQEVLLDRAPDLRTAARAALQKIKEVRIFSPMDFSHLADILLVDQAMEGKILGSEASAIKEDLDLNRHVPILTTEAETDIIRGSFNAPAYGDWVQNFPDQADFVYLEEARLNSAIRFLRDNRNQVVVPDERLVSNLMQIRPDKQQVLRQTFPFTDFETKVWKAKDVIFQNLVTNPRWLERLASLYVIDPTARERFALSPDEKRMLLQLVQTQGSASLERVVRSVTIILADEAELDSRGVIQIRFYPVPVASVQPLPERPSI